MSCHNFESLEGTKNMSLNVTSSWMTDKPPPTVPLHNLFQRTLQRNWLSLPHPQCGLVNLGNTCYMSAVIQALFHVPVFVDWLSKEQCPNKVQECVTCCLQSLLQQMNHSSIVTPSNVLSLSPNAQPGFKFTGEGDVYQYLLNLLIMLHCDFMSRFQDKVFDFWSERTSPIFQMFGMSRQVQSNCTLCENCEEQYMSQLTVSLNILSASSVQYAIDNWLSSNQVSELTSACTCNIVSSEGLKQLPLILILKLDRFTAEGVKILHPIDINIEISVKGHSYQLQSAVIHSGSNLLGGYHSTIVQNSNGYMSLCEDSKVSRISMGAFLHSTRYKLDSFILLYGRLNSKSSQATPESSCRKQTVCRSVPLLKLPKGQRVVYQTVGKRWIVPPRQQDDRKKQKLDASETVVFQDPHSSPRNPEIVACNSSSSLHIKRSGPQLQTVECNSSSPILKKNSSPQLKDVECNSNSSLLIKRSDQQLKVVECKSNSSFLEKSCSPQLQIVECHSNSPLLKTRRTPQLQAVEFNRDSSLLKKRNGPQLRGVECNSSSSLLKKSSSPQLQDVECNSSSSLLKKCSGPQLQETVKIQVKKETCMITRSIGVQVSLFRPCISYVCKTMEKENFRFFTGLTQKKFYVLYDILGGDNTLNALEVNYEHLSSQEKFHNIMVSPKDKLFITLLHLRRGISILDLGKLYNISFKHISIIFFSMIRHMSSIFHPLMDKMFVAPQDQRNSKLCAFKPIKNLRILLGGVKFKVGRPSNTLQQDTVHSDRTNSMIFIVGLSCNGTIIFISPGHKGSISGKDAVLKSGLLEKLKPNDAVMVDEGFNKASELLESGVTFLKPPLSDEDHLSPEFATLTAAANEVQKCFQNVTKKIRQNRLIRLTVPIKLVPILPDIVFVAGYLINFSSHTL